MTTYLEAARFTILDADISVFVKDETFIAVYIDNLLIVGLYISEINSVKKYLSNRFQISNLSPYYYYLSITIRRDRAIRTIYLS